MDKVRPTDEWTTGFPTLMTLDFVSFIISYRSEEATSCKTPYVKKLRRPMFCYFAN